jgi:hypothetical protein
MSVEKTHDIGSAVSLYRSKFSDGPAGAVRNSYPSVDLLWDNVIAGPCEIAPAKTLTASPGPSLTHVGRSALLSARLGHLDP